jgi:Uncharacterized protein conserved in bacteria
MPGRSVQLYGQCTVRSAMIGTKEIDMATSAKRREDRLEIRLPAAAKKVLQRAAVAQRKSISAFILDSGLTAAAEALADRREFKLNAQQYDAFVAALDAPSKSKPRLAKLLKTPSALE